MKVQLTKTPIAKNLKPAKKILTQATQQCKAKLPKIIDCKKQIVPMIYMGGPCEETFVPSGCDYGF